jgi:hypothetical protein
MIGLLKTTLGLAQAINPELARCTQAQHVSYTRERPRASGCEEEEEKGPSEEAQIEAAYLIGRMTRAGNK